MIKPIEFRLDDLAKDALCDDNGIAQPYISETLIEAAQTIRDLRRRLSDANWQINADRQGGA